ncbi:conserved oligomeric Golgi complex subunit 6 [Plasmodium brasilianum]|uniref:Uncharacterized protein n=2 Tax=Plasmodium (Plasmodium) TaxID=418103 RepID=A0A1A8W608_PLAMA|nr:conserved Plasmodium protein, unknown function [Plasmodium malariae]KAI4836641.1 conserved oligomeric Golgi complex subunit 6 [Plasmodium brasilianum]SBS88404.1 hypothetical protein PMALA_022500 [Plasmodium malariae]SCO93921.1 conserved Plasmodium protein, unknown function [Plasmodium malariae]
MDIQTNTTIDIISNADLLNYELDNFKNYKSAFNKYNVLYDNYDNELRELNNYEHVFREACMCFKYFENIHHNLKKVNELDKNTKERILESSEMTKEIVDEIRKLKKEKYDISKKEKIYEKILEEYSLSSLCYNILTDLKISLDIEFFEHLKHFEYTKENIIKLLNENSSEKIYKFYSKHYNQILNKACKKMCLYIIRESNHFFYKKGRKIINLLLCNVYEEKDKRKIIIKNYVGNFSLITKMCYKIIVENIEYFNMCLSNFVHYRKKVIKKNYQDLIANKYKTTTKKMNIQELDDENDYSTQYIKNFFSIIYYLITLEDNFLKIFLLFNNYYASTTVPYISAHVENMHNNLYDIVDTLYIPYTHFVETNLNIYPKSYESCYELFHILSVFIYKLKQFQDNYEINDDIKNIIMEYSTKTIAHNINKNEHSTLKIQNGNGKDYSFLQQDYELILTKKNRNSSSFLCDPSNNITDTVQKMFLNDNNIVLNKRNKENVHANKFSNPENTIWENDPYTEKTENLKKAERNVIQQVEHENNEYIIDDNKCYSMNDSNSNKHNKDKNNAENVNGKNKMKEGSNSRRSNLGDYNKSIEKIISIEKYNCKILSYTQKIQKKVENEFFSLWQQDVVTFYLNKTTKIEDPNFLDNTLFCIKKILNCLNNVYSIYKNRALLETSNNEQNFQSVLDITINPLINNCLKNKNQNVETDYIFIVNIFIFIQDSIKIFEGSSKYCDLLTIIIDEKKEKILQLENFHIMSYLQMDKYCIEHEKKKIDEIKYIVENFYKFVFSEKFNNFNIINKIESNDVKNDLKLAILNNLHKAYVNIYDLYSTEFSMTYTPEQIKDLLLKNY